MNKENRIREVSIGVSAALLLASFTILNETIGIADLSSRNGLFRGGITILLASTPVLALNIYRLFLYKPDGELNEKNRTVLAIDAIVWIVVSIGIALVFGSLKITKSDYLSSGTLPIVVGTIVSFIFFRYAKFDRSKKL